MPKDTLPGTTKSISFTMEESKTTPYSGDNSAIYVVKGHIFFPGTIAWGTPTSIKLLAWVDSGMTGAYRIYDVENSLTIAELTGITATAKGALDMGTLSNLPPAATVFEIQFKRTAGSGAPEIVCAGGVILW